MRQLIPHRISEIVDNILLPICCMHASMPPKRTLRRLRGYPPESQERVEVGSADEEALPPPGSARVDYVCIYPSCLGMQLFRVPRANVRARAPV